MKYITHFTIRVLAWTVVLTLGIANPVFAQQKKPNILFLFADDMVFDAFGKMSDGYIKTPNIDELAEQGVHFTKAYNMGAWAGAVCLSSRTMLNTGLTLWNSKTYSDTRVQLKKLGKQPVKTLNTWSQRMQQAGYHTYMTGKWHVDSHNVAPLFDQIGTERPGMPRTKRTGSDSKTIDHHRPVKGQPDSWHAADKSLAGFWEGGTHWSEVTANEAIDYISTRGKLSKTEDDKEKPFFAYVAFNAPHDPRQSPQNYLDMYALEDVPLPPAFMPSYPYSKQIGSHYIRAEHMTPRPRTEFGIKTHRKEYYALVSHLDTQIGRIMDELERSGLKDNTYVVFTADHGLSLGNHSFMAKQSMYDHSLAAPFIMLGPNIPKNKTSEQRIYVQDVVPTTLDWANADKSEIEFTSIEIDKNGKLTRTAQTIYGAYKDKSRCVIKDNWKLIVYPEVPKLRLFDLKNDPLELIDLAENPVYQKKIQLLKTELINEQKRLSDMFDIEPTFSAVALN